MQILVRYTGSKAAGTDTPNTAEPQQHGVFFRQQPVLANMNLDEDGDGGEAAMHILQQEMEIDDFMTSLVCDDSSSEEDDEAKRKGSRKGKAPNKDRDFHGAYMKVIKHYFNGRNSTYDERDFERRFRCPRTVFNRIHDAMMGQDPFLHYQDATGKLGVYPLVKLVGCFRYIAYGDAYDREDENLEMGESTLEGYVKKFAKLMKNEFGEQYLNRCPTLHEREAISRVMNGKGFPGCLASWDCKHFNWKNCPMRLSGQHKGHSEGGKNTLVLEAISDHRRYIWYANFGDPGSLNDLNILDRSSIVGAMLSGQLDITTDPYTINNNPRDWMYFLVDGIYPEWSIFVNTFNNATDPLKKHFASHQEKVRKDIECAFGVLVSRFHVLQRPIRNWYLEEIVDLLHCCVIIHNMVVDERYGDLGTEADEVRDKAFPLFGYPEVTAALAALEGIDLFAARVSVFHSRMHSAYEHARLKSDLIAHINATIPRKN